MLRICPRFAIVQLVLVFVQIQTVQEFLHSKLLRILLHHLTFEIFELPTSAVLHLLGTAQDQHSLSLLGHPGCINLRRHMPWNVLSSCHASVNSAAQKRKPRHAVKYRKQDL